MDDFKVLDADGVEVPPDVEPPPVVRSPIRTTRMPKLGACATCGTGLYQAKDAARGLCFHCEFDHNQRAEFQREVATPITRADALAELRSMAASKGNDQDGAHIYADHLLLRLLNDPEIAAAWYAIEKWYA